MKKNSKRLLVAIVLLVLLVGAVAYAAASKTLTISGSAEIGADISQVKIDSIVCSDFSGEYPNGNPVESEGVTPLDEGSDYYVYTDADTSANFYVVLPEPGADMTFDVVIKNHGTTKAKLDSIVETATTVNTEDPKAIKFEIVSGPAENDVLEAGDSVTAQVRAYWDESVTTAEAGQTKDFKVDYNYVVAK